jgi:hypothetical protein
MRHWPSQAEIEAAMNDMPVDMVHDLADEAFATLTHTQLVCVLASHAMRQPRVIRTLVTDTLRAMDSV